MKTVLARALPCDGHMQGGRWKPMRVARNHLFVPCVCTHRDLMTVFWEHLRCALRKAKKKLNYKRCSKSESRPNKLTLVACLALKDPYGGLLPLYLTSGASTGGEGAARRGAYVLFRRPFTTIPEVSFFLFFFSLLSLQVLAGS